MVESAPVLTQHHPANKDLFQSPHELLSPEGLRIDGRRWNELRRFEARLSTTTAADGSSYIEWGNTKILCTVTGPVEPKSGANRSQDGATVLVDVCFAAFSGNDRKKRARGDKYDTLNFVPGMLLNADA